MKLKVGILTVSDRSAAGERQDLSGPALVQAVENAGWEVSQQGVIPDEQQQISDTLSAWADGGECSVILTTGGTGFSPRDVTPEATLAVIDREAPGIAEAMRMASLEITLHAMLSRAVAGIRGQSLIINLPGSPKGALENFRIVAPVLSHAVQLLVNDQDAEKGHLRGRSI